MFALGGSCYCEIIAMLEMYSGSIVGYSYHTIPCPGSCDKKPTKNIKKTQNAGGPSADSRKVQLSLQFGSNVQRGVHLYSLIAKRYLVQ